MNELTATPRAAPSPPAMTLGLALDSAAVTVTLDVPAGATRVWLSRIGPSGDEVYVRGVVDLLVTPPTQLLLFDFEAPFDVELEYHASSANAGGETSADTVDSITMPANAGDNPWIVDVGQPGNSQRVVVESLPDLTYAVPAGVHKVIGRRAPIVLSDIAPLPSFELAFVTATEHERDNARGTLGNGIPLLLKTPIEHGVGNMYLSVTAWHEQRVSRIAQHADRRFVVSAQEVRRPDPELVVPTTLIASYLDVRDDFADYADVEASRSSYSALMLTFAGGEGGAVIPWPPRDV